MTRSRTQVAAGPVVRLAIQGRATGAAVDGIRAQVEAALAHERPFAVLFDRSRMTALTPDGREALQRWDDELTPRLPAWCRAWADVYDERRAASLRRAEERSPRPSGRPYPQRTFADSGEAERWLAAHTQF